MEAATSATVTGWGNWRWEPSGSVIWIMVYGARDECQKESAVNAALNPCVENFVRPGRAD